MFDPEDSTFAVIEPADYKGPRTRMKPLRREMRRRGLVDGYLSEMTGYARPTIFRAINGRDGPAFTAVVGILAEDGHGDLVQEIYRLRGSEAQHAA